MFTKNKYGINGKVYFKGSIMTVYIAGNRGLTGTYMMNTWDQAVGGNSDTVDYRNFQQTYDHVKQYSPTQMVINAATVGGLMEDLDRSFDLYLTNMTIQNNLLSVASKLGIQQVLLQGSCCSYPSERPERKFHETDLLNGVPHPGYMPTAMCKIIGLEQCRSHNQLYKTTWTSAINTNLYGPGERTGKQAHVVGALMDKFVRAVKEDWTEVEIWGSGDQTRDMLFVEDAVDAHEYILNNKVYDAVNVCYGEDYKISELAQMIKKISGFQGRLWYNTDQPEGVKHRRLDNKRLCDLGWKPRFTMEEGLTKTYEWYATNDYTK